jgi:restriction system protein
MARRQGFLDDLMIIGSKLPWRVAVFSAVVAFVGLHVVAVQTSSPATGTTLADLGGVVQHTFIHVTAAFLQYIVPIALLLGALGGFVVQSRARSLLKSARANPNAISGMSWRDFERLVGEGFRQRGFAVTGSGGRGPDGGVDLPLTKDGERFLVQCKHWRKEQVGVAVVRELNGVVAAERAAGGFVVTGGRFTAEAQEFARNTAIKLIDGAALEELIGDPREQNAEDVPGCPKCGGEMIERTATRGPFIGKPFWGCRKYPKCTGTARMS